MSTPDARRYSAAAERNREPILAQLLRWLPAHGLALEIAAGSGQHAVHFAAALPGWRWQPSEAASLASITDWRAEADLPNLLPPIALDVLQRPWPVAAPVDAIFCANLLHIAPWEVCAALMQGAGEHLAPAGQLIVYGPFFVDGADTAPSNLAFDADLRLRNPAWGLRRLADVEARAHAAGLMLQERVAMPANNLLLRFARLAPSFRS